MSFALSPGVTLLVLGGLLRQRLTGEMEGWNYARESALGLRPNNGPFLVRDGPANKVGRG